MLENTVERIVDITPITADMIHHIFPEFPCVRIATPKSKTAIAPKNLKTYMIPAKGFTPPAEIDSTTSETIGIPVITRLIMPDSNVRIPAVFNLR